MRPAHLPQPASRRHVDTAVADLLAALAILFATAADRRTHDMVAVELNDIELAHSRLARLLALLRGRDP
jgi:hypothetical protein